MDHVTLILRSLVFHWRAHLAAGLAAAVGTAVLVGALLVGDSVRYSLKTMALERLGKVECALLGGDRFFRADLAQRLSDAGMRCVPMLLMPAVCIHESNGARANQARVLGVPPDFAAVGTHWPREPLKGGETFINARLAAALNAKSGDVVRFRIMKPGLLPLEAPVGSKEAKSAVFRATIKAVLPDRGLGRFSFDANQTAPLNAYLPLAELQERMDQKDRANVLLALHGRDGEAVGTGGLRECWSLDDARLRLRAEPQLGFLELSTPRVFLDDGVCDALLNPRPETRDPKPAAVLTYFVNAIRANGKETPYSMATAGQAPLVPADLKDDEIVLNDWTADDLQAKPGDRVEIEYYTVGLLRKLETHKATFTLKAIVLMEGAYADRNLMPEFPGIANVDTTHDWDSSIPIDMRKIRAKDELYWKEHRGTPKAFVTLRAGVRLWKNRFGTYTALRFPLHGDPAQAQAALDKRIHEAVSPAAVGLAFTPVRDMALKASAQALDFGGLFLGFSFFLIAAALLLMALIFHFNIASRAAETGLLLALGFTPRAVRWLLWAEGTLMAALGALAGAAGGAAFAQVLLYELATRWRDAVGTSTLEYHAEPLSLLIGYAAGVAAASIAILSAVRRQAALPARELLASTGFEEPSPRKPSRAWLIAGAVSLSGAMATIAAVLARGETSPQAFFAAGGLLLLAGLCGVRLLLAGRPAPGAAAVPSLTRLGVRGAARRAGRSLATAMLLACGSFLIVAVGANQQDALRDAERKESGTGGFALWGRATMPVFDDLNTSDGRTKAGVPDEGFAGVTIYPLRVKDGDEASCLNLNRAQRPRILGVPEAFVRRGGFAFAAVAGKVPSATNPWASLLAPSPRAPAGEAPAAPAEGGADIAGVCDYQSLTWALGKKVGDTIAVPDDGGIGRRIRIVGAVANSILQGSILISEQDFLTLYPSESGYREFLVDAPRERTADVAKMLSGALQDEGFEAEPAVQRLAEFNAVQNTYLSTFQALGALGLLLGSLGLGIVVLRNMLERRAELAVLRAIGFSRRDVGWLVLGEHAWLLLLGLGVGVGAALPAVAPVLSAAGAALPWQALLVALAAVVLFGLASAALATWAMLRAPLLPALRNE